MESRTIRYGVTAFTTLLLTFSGSACSKEPEAPALAHDPGVRNDGDPGAGTPYPGLPDPFQKLFNAGQDEFAKPDQVVEDGLGPRMNLDRCVGCHSNPASGGSSPETNQQFSFFKDSLDHKTNTLPSFITENGPTREARFQGSQGRGGSEERRSRWRCPRPVHQCRNEGRGKLQVRTA
jgi:hypothetical protein